MRACRTIAVATALGLAALGFASGPATAAGASRSCGQVRGAALHAHDLSCATARRVYKLDLSGHLPAGWTCSASLGRCAEGKLGSARYFDWG